MQFDQTIFALSSGHLPSGVAVIRVSGPHCRFVTETIIGALPTSRQAQYGVLKDTSGGIIDHGLTLFFPAPASFTGEDVTEFHVHGGRAVVAAVLQCLSSLPGCRHAEAGEFSRRSFLNGKMDLLGVEAVADLIAAETEAERRLAVQNSSGIQAELYAAWRRRLIHARAMIEAEMDFSDEGDIPGSVSDMVWRDIETLVVEIYDHIAGFRRTEIIRDGFDVVIVGAPNAGKSSLLNALLERDAAIVADEPGTTRDLVETVLDIDGIKVRLTDTAGLRDGAGKVESIGIDRARRRAEHADLVLYLRDVADFSDLLPYSGEGVLRIGSKVDLSETQPSTIMYDCLVSSVSGEGLETLRSLISSRASASLGNRSDILPSRLRHVELLQQALKALQTAASDETKPLELRAEDLRQASHVIGRVSGEVDVEDLLDVIFSQFCVGK
ncbi:tRNA uridine-5-carboxymethylaminomethyl(34) synthesis GTPase MnmE [Corticibacterium sp. UT-5YL-CI-8]|nr:tRNA uridine-5-carboxymethylaminomethyl(34) synthesis GTPase MnmE [Tianweitania sp. UT-5YL-CI-8]